MRFLALSLLLTACASSMPPAAREADRLLRAGELDEADRVATGELARSPDQAHLRRVWIGVALARRDGKEAVARYQTWRERRGTDDPAALRSMALSTLWRGLADPEPAVRLAAIDAAEAEDLDELYGDVARLLEGDEDPVVRARAAAALFAGDPRAPELLAAAAEGDSAAARKVAIAALARRVGERTLPGLREALGDEDAGVRQAACAALGRLGDRSDAAALTLLATKEGSGPVRAEAIAALVRLGLPVPASAFADAYLGARTAAVAGADPQTLARLAASDDLPIAVVAAARAKLAAPFTRAAADDDATVRALVANLAPGALGPAAKPLAVRLAEDPDPAVRAAAVRALAALGDDPAARRVATALLGGAAPGPKLQAAVWLDEHGDRAGTDALRALVSDADVTTRRATVAATRHQGILVIALGDDDPLLRVTAARSLLR
jgi:HEAT repeat protein